MNKGGIGPVFLGPARLKAENTNFAMVPAFNFFRILNKLRPAELY